MRFGACVGSLITGSRSMLLWCQETDVVWNDGEMNQLGRGKKFGGEPIELLVNARYSPLSEAFTTVNVPRIDL